MPEQKTVLIMEDEAPMLEAISKKISSQGHKVISAPDGEAGLKLALEERPDLVMLDILMPKMDGMEVMKRIREDNKWGKEVPIVMLTNLSDPDKVSEAANYGVYDFLVKTDWRLDDVVTLINQKLNLNS